MDFPADYPQTVTLKTGKILTHHPYKVKLFRQLAFQIWRFCRVCVHFAGLGAFSAGEAVVPAHLHPEQGHPVKQRVKRTGGQNMIRSAIIAGRMRKPVV